ncbi:MAG: hypothetical protein V1899_05545 [Planctomycetota bacterium]
MRIKLRPYHIFAVIRQLATGPTKEDIDRFRGMPIVTEKIKTDPDVEIVLVKEYDDACVHCAARVPDENGSIWGEGFSCPSSKDQARAEKVTDSMYEILRDIGLRFGSVMKARDLLRLAIEKRPSHYEGKSDAYRKQYEDGKIKVAELL